MARAAQYSPIRRVDGYLPIEDHALIGDGATAALVGRDGAIPWLCLPRFDAPPLFCALLDAARGGAFALAPEDLVESQQWYETDTGVVVTEMRGRTGLVRVTDALALGAGADLRQDLPASRGALVRVVSVLRGPVRLRVAVEPRGGAVAERAVGGLAVRCPARPDLDLHLRSSVPLDGLRATLALETGARVDLVLRWKPAPVSETETGADDLLRATLEAWRRWAGCIAYDGPAEPLVRRSAITLKLLDYFANGALVAAPTSSLPEAVGGSRNWDYRYAWVRDAAFSVYAFHRIGLRAEAHGFLKWVLAAVDRDGRPKVLYDLDGKEPPPERGDPELSGYRNSRPVRWGNAAADQVQHDVFGEILDCAWQWASHHGSIEPRLWQSLVRLVEAARLEYREPDQGIWEVRTARRPFTYSAALCQAALDRGARLAERFGLPGDPRRWRAAAEGIRRALVEESWDPTIGAFTEHLGGGGLDASVLALPIRRIVPAGHPRMVATATAIRERLSAGRGLLYRYLPHVSPDGLPGHEGAFLLCSFWLVDNLTHQGRFDEAADLYESLCARANAVGLLPEQIDPASGAFLGNFPQAFSHVGLISSGVNLARRPRQMRR